MTSSDSMNGYRGVTRVAGEIRGLGVGSDHDEARRPMTTPMSHEMTPHEPPDGCLVLHGGCRREG
ncbi:MAG TPA: hypothetical protein PLF04_04935 [Candidatus Fermentibacter daniensis]|nr:MAG: hypothetical protein AO396_01980 [Candidatus Fermentibacter daniensis]HOD19041.1 hypothetical protein [Candidatus Fermentibacter daniensis]HOZ17660.1 hypothetical protein [Candidatus Fermentibacter daniensis]HPH39334.1 hypothetical protein [Candidatus Fermentibacter daniensis]HPN62381.1 hypothetical protein [Candidatus Fermentibacter daniensis]